MFSMPKKALYKPISRRKFLELGGGRRDPRSVWARSQSA